MKLPAMRWERTRESEGLPCPKYMGYAYRDFNRDITVYWIVPINLIVAGWLWFVYQVRWGFHPKDIMEVANAKRAERLRCIKVVERSNIDLGMKMQIINAINARAYE